MGKFEQQRRPSLWLAIPVVMVLTIVWTKADYPLDYWLHINNGGWMIQHGRLIDHDTFSHTIDGQPVNNQPWLAQIWMYQVHRVGGYALNQFIAGLGYAAGVLTVMYLVGRRCQNWTLAALAGCVTVAVMSTNLGIRPQYFSVVLFSMQLFILNRARRTLPLVVGCFVIGALWTNLHGAYPLCVAVPGVYLASALLEAWMNRADQHASRSQPLTRTHHLARVQRFGLATGAAAVACFVRPVPTDAISYVLNCGSRSVERGLVEWLPTSLGTESGPAFFASVVALVAVLSLSRRRSEVHEVLLLMAFFLLACSSQRMVMWWAIIFPVMCARPADQVWRHAVAWARRKRAGQSGDNASSVANPTLDRILATTVVVCVTVFMIVSTPWTRSVNACLPPEKRVVILHDEPYHLVQDTVKTLPSSVDHVNTYAPLSWGPYLTWHSAGKLKTFLDTRVDFFPAKIWSAYEAITLGSEQTDGLLAQYNVDIVICRANQVRLIQRLSSSDRWRPVYSDDVGKVFHRD